jgi:hypothetical protein
MAPPPASIISGAFPNAAGDSFMPPSTIPAQILHNRNNAATQQEPGLIKEQFDRLLKDYLDDPVVDADQFKIPENARFVTLLLNTAVEARSASDIFAVNSVTQQVVDCLKAVQFTVQRQPDILFFNRPDDAGNGVEPPMLFSIMSCCFRLAILKHQDPVWNQLVELLVELHKCLSVRPLDLWNEESLCQVYYTAVEGKIRMPTPYMSLSRVPDLLHAFDDSASSNEVTLGFHLVLPSLESISLFWTSVEHSVALQSGYQVTLKSRNHATSIALLLIEVLGIVDDSSLLVFDSARQLVDHASSPRKRDRVAGTKVVAGLTKLCLTETSSDLSQVRLCAVEDLLNRLIPLMGYDPDEDSQLGIALCILQLVQLRRKRTLKPSCPSLGRTLLGAGDQHIDFTGLDADYQVCPTMITCI